MVQRQPREAKGGLNYTLEQYQLLDSVRPLGEVDGNTYSTIHLIFEWSVCIVYLLCLEYKGFTIKKSIHKCILWRFDFLCTFQFRSLVDTQIKTPLVSFPKWLSSSLGCLIPAWRWIAQQLANPTINTRRTKSVPSIRRRTTQQAFTLLQTQFLTLQKCLIHLNKPILKTRRTKLYIWLLMKSQVPRSL